MNGDETPKARSPGRKLSPIPPANLLLSLPRILIQPPSDSLHQVSLHLSLLAIRAALRCRERGGLSVDLEARAWSALAEVGMMVVEGGFCEEGKGEAEWAQGVVNEIVMATSKGIHLATTHPSLRLYRPHLTIISARLASMQGNHGLAKTLLKRLLNTLSDDSWPQHVVYTAWIEYIRCLTANVVTSLQVSQALNAIESLHNLAISNGHQQIARLSIAMKLRFLLGVGLWADSRVEEAFSQCPDVATPADDPITSLINLHILLLMTLYHTYRGEDAKASPILDSLHVLMDSGLLLKLAASEGKNGVVEIQLDPEYKRSVFVHLTPPPHLHILAFLVSALSKRDPVGRKPRRKVFALEGLRVWEKKEREESEFPPFSTLSAVQDHCHKMGRMKADLMCEVIGVSIQRSEFHLARQTLDALIAHLRELDLFPAYAARISLHQAHLAHARGNKGQGDLERAKKCYQVAAYLASGTGNVGSAGSTHKEEDWRGDASEYVYVAALVGDWALRLGAFRERWAGKARKRRKKHPERTGDTAVTTADADIAEELAVNRTLLDNADLMEVDVDTGHEPEQDQGVEEEWHADPEWLELLQLSKEIAAKAAEMGGTLQGMGKIVEACCLSEGVVTAKSNLRTCLSYATNSADNHLRALALALIASHFFHTSPNYACEALSISQNLGSGMGAVAKSEGGKKASQGVGNAPLRMWIGERFLEMYKRSGDEVKVKGQEDANEALRRTIEMEEKKMKSVSDASRCARTLDSKILSHSTAQMNRARCQTSASQTAFVKTKRTAASYCVEVP